MYTIGRAMKDYSITRAARAVPSRRLINWRNSFERLTSLSRAPPSPRGCSSSSDRSIRVLLGRAISFPSQRELGETARRYGHNPQATTPVSHPRSPVDTVHGGESITCSTIVQSDGKDASRHPILARGSRRRRSDATGSRRRSSTSLSISRPPLFEALRVVLRKCRPSYGCSQWS